MPRTIPSLARTRRPRRVRELVNEQERLKISERLRELRDNSPETNRSIGDYVGVSERTVAAWMGGEQGITYQNAQKIAELFGCDFDWLWRGRQSEPPHGGLLDALGGGGIESRLMSLEAAVAENSRLLLKILEMWERRDAELAEAADESGESGESRKPWQGPATDH